MTDSYYEKFDYKSELLKEIVELKERIKIQQEALNAVTPIIDELRRENRTLKDGLYLRDLNNEIARLKKQVIDITEQYILQSERYNDLMAKYIQQ